MTVTGEGRGKGPELDINGDMLPGWNVIVAYTNQDVRTTKANPGSNQVPGQRFPDIPQNLGSFWTTYEFQQESLKGWKIGGGVIYHGSEPVFAFGGNFEGASSMAAPYATVNLMGAYSFKFADTKMTAQVNVTNLLDAAYYTQAGVLDSFAPRPGFAANATRLCGAPLTILGSLRAEF